MHRETLDIWCHQHPRTLGVRLCRSWARKRSYGPMPSNSRSQPARPSHHTDLALYLPYKLSKHLPMKQMPCCISFFPSLLPRRRKTDCARDFPFPQFKRRRGAAAADSGSVAVRGADVGGAALNLPLSVPPACPVRSLDWEGGKST